MRCMSLSLARGRKASQVSKRRVSSSVGREFRRNRWLSARERVSMSFTRTDMRLASVFMMPRNASCSLWEAFLEAETADKITARGVRSSWDAAAIKAFCFSWEDCMGAKSLPV